MADKNKTKESNSSKTSTPAASTTTAALATAAVVPKKKDTPRTTFKAYCPICKDEVIHNPSADGRVPNCIYGHGMKSKAQTNHSQTRSPSVYAPDMSFENWCFHGGKKPASGFVKPLGAGMSNTMTKAA